MKIIETERLYLRQLSIHDAENLYRLNLDPDVIRFTGDSPFRSIEEAKQFLENYDHYQKYGFGRWAVIEKNDDEFIGWCGLKYSPSLAEHDIGFRFFKSCWNRGYATEAALASINHAFEILHLQRIVGRAMKENIASVSVLEKIGLSFLGEFDFDGSDGVLYCIENTADQEFENGA